MKLGRPYEGDRDRRREAGDKGYAIEKGIMNLRWENRVQSKGS